MSDKKASECICIHLDAGHDNNGNPKRAYMVIHTSGDIVAVIDEGYYGSKALNKTFGDKIGTDLYLRYSGTIATTKLQLRDLFKDFSEPRYTLI